MGDPLDKEIDALNNKPLGAPIHVQQASAGGVTVQHALNSLVEASLVVEGGGNLAASQSGLVTGSGGVSLENPTLAAVVMYTTRGALNDGVLDAGETAAIKSLVGQASNGGAKNLTADLDGSFAQKGMDKFESLPAPAQHAILLRARELQGIGDVAAYTKAVLTIAAHFNPESPDLAGAVASANSGLPTARANSVQR